MIGFYMKCNTGLKCVKKILDAAVHSFVVENSSEMCYEICRKTLVLHSLFNNVCRPTASKFNLKKRLEHIVFLVGFANFSRNVFLQNTTRHSLDFYSVSLATSMQGKKSLLEIFCQGIHLVIRGCYLKPARCLR